MNIVMYVSYLFWNEFFFGGFMLSSEIGLYPGLNLQENGLLVMANRLF